MSTISQAYAPESGHWKPFLGFALRVILAHTLTYFIFGMLMSNVFHYGEIFRQDIIRDYMLPMDAGNVILGPFMQPVRGLIFAIGLWPVRGLLIERKRGWLILWGLLVTLGILSTPAASPGSIEGMLYTRLPLWYHLLGYPEIVLQTLAFSIWLVWWERRTMKNQEGVARQENTLVPEIVKAIMAACFAYIGYAAGGLLLVGIANAGAGASGAETVDIQAAGADFKMQFMFVVAFFVNAISVFWMARRWQSRKIALWGLLLLFWFIDALVPWLYQTVVFGSSFIPAVMLLGLFPAIIITISMRLNYKTNF
jgi:hypothetical protein